MAITLGSWEGICGIVRLANPVEVFLLFLFSKNGSVVVILKIDFLQRPVTLWPFSSCLHPESHSAAKALIPSLDLHSPWEALPNRADEPLALVLATSFPGFPPLENSSLSPRYTPELSQAASIHCTSSLFGKRCVGVQFCVRWIWTDRKSPCDLW